MTKFHIIWRNTVIYIVEYFGALSFLILIPAFDYITIGGIVFRPHPSVPPLLYGFLVTAVGVLILSTLLTIPLRETLGSEWRIPRFSPLTFGGVLLTFVVGDYFFTQLWGGKMPSPEWIWTWDSVLPTVFKTTVHAFEEEWLFRGYLFARWSRISRWQRSLLGLPLSTAIIVTSALFALMHIFQRPLALATFFPGLFFGMLREKSGNIVTPTIAHVIFNLWQHQFS